MRTKFLLKSDNVIAKRLGENILLQKKNHTLNTIVKNTNESCEVGKIANNSLQLLLAKLMSEMDKEKQQIKMTNDENVCDFNSSKSYLKNTISFNQIKIASLEKNNRIQNDKLEE